MSLKNNKILQTRNVIDYCTEEMSNSDYDNYVFDEGEIIIKRYNNDPYWDSFELKYHHTGLISKDSKFSKAKVVKAQGKCDYIQNPECKPKDEVINHDMDKSSSWNSQGTRNIEKNSNECNSVRYYKFLEVKGAFSSTEQRAVNYAISLAKGNTVYGITSDKTSTDKTYCSKLVYQSYDMAGDFDLDDDSIWYVTPDDIYYDDDTKKLDTFWVD